MRIARVPEQQRDPLDLLGGLRQQDAPPELDRPPHRPPLSGDRRVLLIGLALIPVLAVLAAVALLPRGPDGETATPIRPAAAGGSPQPAGSAAPDTQDTADATVGDLQQVPPDRALADLTNAGVQPGGDIAGGWAWDDANGRNLLVTASAAGRVAGSYDLRVTQLAGVGEAARVLRVMREPGVPRCGSGSGTARFTPGSVTVRDLDRDGIGEVSVGWSFGCSAAGAKTEAKLVLLAGGQKHILRGRGVIGRPGSGGFVPDPAPGSWPEGYLDALTALFHQLYY